jgi:hypothetical protein
MYWSCIEVVLEEYGPGSYVSNFRALKLLVR